MSLSQGRGHTRLTEIGGPMPIPYLWHILEMLPDVFVMRKQLAVEQIDGICGFNSQPRNMFERLESEVEAAHLIEHDHIKRRGGGSAVHVTAHVETAFIGTSVNHTVDEPPVVVE